jgi:hypothetical protein
VGGSSFFQTKGWGPPLNFDPVRPMVMVYFVNRKNKCVKKPIDVTVPKLKFLDQIVKSSLSWALFQGGRTGAGVACRRRRRKQRSDNGGRGSEIWKPQFGTTKNSISVILRCSVVKKNVCAFIKKIDFVGYCMVFVWFLFGSGVGGWRREKGSNPCEAGWVH